MKDGIVLKGIDFYGYCGVSAHERKIGQRFSLDLELFLDLKEAGKYDDLSKTVDYSRVYALAKDIAEKKKYRLLETMAENIAQTILKKFKKVKAVGVRVRKPQPPVGGLIDYVEVKIKCHAEQNSNDK